MNREKGKHAWKVKRNKQAEKKGETNDEKGNNFKSTHGVTRDV